MIGVKIKQIVRDSGRWDSICSRVATARNFSP